MCSIENQPSICRQPTATGSTASAALVGMSILRERRSRPRQGAEEGEQCRSGACHRHARSPTWTRPRRATRQPAGRARSRQGTDRCESEGLRLSDGGRCRSSMTSPFGPSSRPTQQRPLALRGRMVERRSQGQSLPAVRTALRRSPRPSTSLVPPTSEKGTSAPSDSARSDNGLLVEAESSGHHAKRSSGISTPAAETCIP